MQTHLFDLAHLVSGLMSGSSTSAPVVLLYFGPETILPLASFLAAAAGVILMFWRQILVTIRKAYRMVLRKGDEPVQVRDDLDMELSITTAAPEGSVSSKGEGE